MVGGIGCERLFALLARPGPQTGPPLQFVRKEHVVCFTSSLEFGGGCNASLHDPVASLSASQTIALAAKALVEGFGGKLNSYYLALGEYDGVAICAFPDNKSGDVVAV